MKRANTIKKREEFDHIIKKTTSVKNSFYVLHYLKQKEDISRFGIAVGVKVGNAVTRNKLKRRVKEIIKEEKNLFPKNLDYIIIVRKQCLDLNYKQMKERLIELIKQVKIWKKDGFY